MVASPYTAFATAYGCTFKSGFIDPNSYCVTLVGTSTYVNYVSGTFNGGTPVANNYITAEFFDTGWHWYKTYKSSVSYGTTNSMTKKIAINAYMKPGYMCSTLHYYVSGFGNRAMSVCHQIKR